ncbi:ATP-binding protein [Selenomonas caprae]|uniref:ATP-binding protein n=1 Tax=Selenomonas caprae TaxID=2606905 RepID=A0A5D6WHA1_9FIRM|nr:AAA family ATPase [Selenomonas caprae]TYZ27453.1 ATP-binding protein [Selenomonas caprae]
MANIKKYTRLKSMDILELKGLNNCHIEFNKNLVAIMGVNGIGKSTIIQALACSFKPVDRGNEKDVLGENHPFSEFFRPNPDATWRNSNFTLTFEEITEVTEKKDGKNETTKYTKTYPREYSKKVDRWAPRRAYLPIKDVRYIGIQTCVPEIEKNKKQGRISYKKEDLTEELFQKILDDVRYILNKEYIGITENTTDTTSMVGVKTPDIDYSALSMGAGEQRTFTIIKTLHELKNNSIVLIDEIDLLMHSDALKRMIHRINNIAIKKNMQVIFTTHSLVMDKMNNIVDIKFLQKGEQKTLVFEGLSSIAWDDLTGESSRPLKIFVEDDLAETIIYRLAANLNIRHKLKVMHFGSIANGFTIAASYLLTNQSLDNVLVVLDGDEYRSLDDKRKMLNQRLSGSERNHRQKIENALEIISQFCLPEGQPPEEFIFNKLKEINTDDEIICEAKKIYGVCNTHDWINTIVDRIGGNRAVVLDQIVTLCANEEWWNTYTDDVEKWLEDRKEI